MKSIWKSIISLLLVLVFIFQLFPASSFAVEGDEESFDESIENVEPEISSKEADQLGSDVSVPEEASEASYIVGEMDDLRDESVKHFRMNDGTFTAVEYGYPIHFKDVDDNWQDIDNTLVKTGNKLVSVNGDMTKSFPDSLATGELFEMRYKDYEITMSLVSEESKAVPAERSETQETASPAESSRPEETAGPQESVSEEDSSALSENTRPEDTAEPEPEVAAEETDAVESAEPSVTPAATEEPSQNAAAAEAETSPPVESPAAATIAPVENAQDGKQYHYVQNTAVKTVVDNPAPTEKIAGLSSMEEMISLDKINSTVRFDNALNKVDFVYVNHGYDLKESIIIREPHTEYQYSFALSLTGLTPALQEDGSILLNNSQNEPVFEIPAPYMFDANGEISDLAQYSLLKSDNGYVLIVSADAAWMNAEDRAFPVTLDPTIIKHNDGGVLTTMIRSSALTSTSPSFADLYCGLNNESNFGTCEIVFQVESKPTLPTNCVVVNSTLMMYHAGFFTSSFGDATSGSLTIQVKKLNNYSANVTALTYNKVHDTLGINSTVLDHQKLSTSTRNKYVTWDVTSAALSWISSSSSTKIAFLLTPYDHQSQQRFCNLVGHGSNVNSPYFTVSYRNTVGLEDYYTYEQASVGRAGNVYFEHFSNKMTIEHPDVTLKLAPANISITHYYNSGYSGNYFSNGFAAMNTCDFSKMILGDGWKLSVQQTVVQRTVGEVTYLVYTDADGTQHYFAKESSSSTYKDEDGLGLRITKSTSGGNTTYTMKDTDDYNTWVFYNGYLISQTDHNGNALYIAYNNIYSSSGSSWKPSSSGTNNKIVQVVQHTDSSNAPYIEVAKFTYNSNGFLTKIKDYAGRETTFSYSGTHLTTITDPDGKQSVYSYDNANSNLIGVYDSEAKYGLEFTYHTSALYGMTHRTINRVSEYSDSSGERKYGNRFHMFRNGNQLTSIRYYGADHTEDPDKTAATADDLVVYNAFDYYGRTITSYTTNSCKDHLLGVTAGAYKPNSNTNPEGNNRLSKSASSGQHVENRILNSGFEKDLTGWTKIASSDDTGNANAASGGYFNYEAGHYTGIIYPHMGAKQLKTFLGGSTTLQDGYCYLRKQVNVTAGETYTFSAYINTSALKTLDGSSSDHGSYLAVMNSDGTSIYKKSEIVNYFTEPAIENGWERISVTYKPSSSGARYFAVCQKGVLGITAFDDIQLEIGNTRSKVNLIQDGSFDRTTGTTYWSTRTIVDNPPTGDEWFYGGKAIKLIGSSTSNVRVSQTVKVNKSSDTTFILSGWGRANSVFFAAKDDGTSYDRFFGLIASIKYDGVTNTEPHYIPFSPSYSDWQYASGVVVPKQANKTIESITVYCAYDKNANSAYFDNISLIQEPAQTYSYDSKGNPVAATADKAKTAYEYFSGTSKLKNYTTPSGTKHSFTYQSGTNNIASETVAGLATTMSYTSAGNVIVTKTKPNSSDLFLQSVDWYDDSLNHHTSSTDVNGIQTTYGYDPTTHLLYNSKLSDRPYQQYRYNTSNSRISQTYISGIDSILYEYYRGRLNTLTRKSFSDFNGSSPFWQRYVLSYNAFGSSTYVGVASKASESADFPTSSKLIKHSYESTVNDHAVNNGRLSKMTYPNGSNVQYSYDLFDRVTSESYNNSNGALSKQHKYYYDAEGSLARQESLNSSGSVTEAYIYDYDSLGRLIHSKELDGNKNLVLRTEHQYDTSNRLKKQNWMLPNGAAYTQSYTYSDGANGKETLSSITSKFSVGSSYYTPSMSFEYNTLRQIWKKTTGTLFYRAYSYKSGSETNQKKAQIDYLNYREYNNGNEGDLVLGYRYYYDSTGNISSVWNSAKVGQTNASADQTYTYDSLGQLTQCVDKSGSTTKTYKYTYDTAGNILTLKTTANSSTTTKTLTYGDSVWKDRLTSVTAKGVTKNITYETATDGCISGNPISYYNGKQYTFSWKDGRQLASTSVDGTTITYDYDMSGVRSKKTVGSTAYTYDTLSGLVVHQHWGTSKDMYFVYDDNNQPYAVFYKNGSGSLYRYYYLLNQQGDVIALMNGNHELVAKYRYDPWGAVTIETDTSTIGIGTLNPLRYRGYFYDSDTGLYYLQSRYYDPAIGRFINADTFATTDANGFLSCNMFAYCENDPINHSDPNGEELWGALIGATSSALWSIALQALDGKEIDWKKVGVSAACGFASGLSFGGTILRVGIGFAAGFADSYYSNSGNPNVSNGQRLIEAFTSGGINALTNAINIQADTKTVSSSFKALKTSAGVFKNHIQKGTNRIVEKGIKLAKNTAKFVSTYVKESLFYALNPATNSYAAKRVYYAIRALQ